MASFTEAIALEGRDGRYTANLDPEWTVSGNPHGGYLLAVLAHAAILADDERTHPHPLSASAVYMKPPSVGPATIQVEHLRRGRAASQLRARMLQDDTSRAEALFTLGRLTDHADQTWVDGPPPAMTPLEDCPVSVVAPPGAGVRVEMLNIVEQRIDPASFRGDGSDGSGAGSGVSGAGSGEFGAGSGEFGAGSGELGTGSGEFRSWLRFPDGTPFDALSLMYAADSSPPATLTLGSFGWVPTVEMTVYLRAIPEPGPLRIRQRARVLAAPVVDQTCEIWDAKDRVVAQATQLAFFRLRGAA